MGLFSKKEKRTEEVNEANVDDVLLKALLGNTSITRQEAMNIPSVQSCVNFIADTVSMIPFKLYRDIDGKSEEVKGDIRVSLLNDDTRDTLDAVQFWRALIADYFLGKGGYAYIKKIRNKIESLHYVDETFVTPNKNTDPIFKDFDFLVHGKRYKPFEFIKLLRNTKDGAQGTSVIDENNLIMSVAYHTLCFEEILVKKGGNKKGFLKSQKKLSDIALAALKAAFKKLYSNNSENVVVLNDGVEFQEASNTSVEMQLNENKETNSSEICKLFKVPESITKGNASKDDYAKGIKTGVLPVLKVIECALNRDLLLEKEKGSFYFAADTKELLKGDIKERFEAYKTAIEANFMQIDEVRYMENLPSLGLDWIKLGLDSVLYDVKTKTVYTPNTNQSNKIDGLKGGENNESRNQS